MPTKQKGQKRKKRGGKPLSEMNFGAAESFIQGDWSALEGVQKFLDESSTMGKLNKMIAKRMGGRVYTDPRINNIIKNTTRMLSEGRKTKLREFVYDDGKFVKPGIFYHTHYTKDLGEHYMTGWSHNPESKLIFPTKLSVFSTYNSLNKQAPMHIEPTFRKITGKDYSNGVITRYFARKSNQVMSSPFEITSNQFNTSPLYIYTSFLWRITGNKEMVSKLNTRAIKKAVRDIPNIDKLLNPFQFYRGNEALNTEEDVLDKLGIVKTTQQTTTENTTTATTTTTTPSTTTTQTGPPPGVTTGGAGGAY